MVFIQEIGNMPNYVNPYCYEVIVESINNKVFYFIKADLFDINRFTYTARISEAINNFELALKIRNELNAIFSYYFLRQEEKSIQLIIHNDNYKIVDLKTGNVLSCLKECFIQRCTV